MSKNVRKIIISFVDYIIFAGFLWELLKKESQEFFLPGYESLYLGIGFSISILLSFMCFFGIYKIEKSNEGIFSYLEWCDRVFGILIVIQFFFEFYLGLFAFLSLELIIAIVYIASSGKTKKNLSGLIINIGLVSIITIYLFGLIYAQDWMDEFGYDLLIKGGLIFAFGLIIYYIVLRFHQKR
ncbi:hypothetical protein NEF87_000203 [Candidatus Lokiarchaeum ossiferum]|uniref:Uncharacterized protein n=1 Tax=Candidatus Lokiarchaeum ossiferum TaxID=2951803 RepID=A0ABY6HK85_9ARCH|nr:hypothetical protein NEF87_000203 [Candidatus Lokiarchaeum sp. B-35]